MGFKRFRGAAAAGAFTLVVCTQWSAAARADEHAFLFEDGAELLAQARELYVEGTKAVHQGQLERARLFYLSAWRAQRHWQIAGSLGHVEVALDRYRDAAEHLSIFVRETRALPASDLRVDPRDAAILAQELDRAKAHVGTVALTVEPAGAEVLVDGAPAGRAPLADPVFVEPGLHVIEAHLDGYRAASESRDLVPGAVAQISLKLAPAPRRSRWPPRPRRPASRPALTPVAMGARPGRDGRARAAALAARAAGGPEPRRPGGADRRRRADRGGPGDGRRLRRALERGRAGARHAPGRLRGRSARRVRRVRRPRADDLDHRQRRRLQLRRRGRARPRHGRVRHRGAPVAAERQGDGLRRARRGRRERLLRLVIFVALVRTWGENR